MNLDEERKAFDAYFRDKYPLLYKDVFDEDGDDRAIIGYSFAWQSWQAAKAQAIPDGFVVVPKDLIQSIHQSCVRCLDIDLPPIFRATICTIRDEVATLIEAQEPAND